MSPFDQRGRLREGQFDYQVTADHRVLIRWHGKQVKILKGPPAEKFIRQAEDLDELNLQLLLARVTGNFKHGNEHKG